jgi:hypothetical protein
MSERLFARRLARELSFDETRLVGGADDPPADPSPRLCWSCVPNNVGPQGGDDRVYGPD